MAAKLICSLLDNSGESAFAVFPGLTFTALNFDAQVALQDALIATLGGIVLGNPYKIVRVAEVVSLPRTAATLQAAQRQCKWRVTYEDLVLHVLNSVDLPLADLSLTVGNSDLADMANADIMAFVAAFEAYFRSTSGNPVQVRRIRAVGRSASLSCQVPNLLLLYDEFDGVGALSAHVPAPVNRPGANWTEEIAGYTLSGGRAVAVGNSKAYLNAKTADVVLETIVRLSTFGVTGFVARRADAAHAWWIMLNAVDDIIGIYEYDSGVPTLRASAAVTINPGVDYLLRAALHGNNITGFVSGVTVGYTSSLHATATRHGLRAPEVNNRFEYFKVWRA